MKMSVFCQGAPLRQLDHLALVNLAVDNESVEMALHAHLHSATVLVGLEEGEAIVKPSETGDEHLSFEALYDTCITLHQFRRMRQLKVKFVADFPPSVYEVEMVLQVNMVPRVRLRVVAKDDRALRQRLLELVNVDPDFRRDLYSRIVNCLLEAGNDVDLITSGGLRCEDAGPKTPAWEFIDT